MDFTKLITFFSKQHLWTRIYKPEDLTAPIAKAIEDSGKKTAQEISKLFSQVEHIKGEKGDVGVQGKDGVDGKDGKDGKDGLNGKDGKPGKDGKEGRPGKDGLPGADGHTPVKGVDYFTPTEKLEIKKEVTPKKGKDYFTSSEEKSLVSKVAKQVAKDAPDLSQRQVVLFQRQPKLDVGDLSDVNLSGTTDGQALTFQASTGKWRNQTISSGGGTVNSVVAGTGISVDNTDPSNPIVTSTITQYTDEAAQDAVGAMIADTATIDLTYTDATPELKADVKDASVTYAKIQNVSATSRVLGRITAGAGSAEELTGSNVRTIAGLATSDSPQFTAIELGNASDTTLSRASGGQLAVEGVNVLMNGGALGTPSSGVATNLTGTAAGLTAGAVTVPAALGSSTATTQSPSDNSTKVATTAYVDNAVLGQNFKEAVKVATTANLVGTYSNGVSGVGATFTYTATGVDTIDGVSLALNDRVLLKNQSTDLQNGIYKVTTAGAIGIAGILTRAVDADQSGEFKTGDSVFVTAGTTLTSTTWAYTGVTSPTMGTDSITFAQVAGQGSFTGGNGITITGTSIAIDTSVTVDKTTVQTLTNKTLTAPVMTAPVLGTPASGVMTNVTGLPAAAILAGTFGAGDYSFGTANKVTLGTIELGAASDTTLSRSAAGKLAVEGTDVLLNGGALGTPSSGTLTNATGLPVAGITSSTSTALGVGSLEIGHASDTTLARVSAGVASIEGKNIALNGTSEVLTTGSIELGHASDTTISRASAGVAAVEGNNIVVNTSSPTLATITTTGNIELGNASDTTLSRSAAGVLAVEGVDVLTTSNTKTLTNKTLNSNTNTIGASNLISFNSPDTFAINAKISVTVASNNITVALKGWDGNDPSATNPVYFMTNGTIRTVTAALSLTLNAGTNHFNAGGSELAAQEIDYFVYLEWNSALGTPAAEIGFSRYIGYCGADFSSTGTNEKFFAQGGASFPANTDVFCLIGRFAASKSAAAGYNWSVPTFTPTNLIQRPFYETRWLAWSPTRAVSGGTVPTYTAIDQSRYKIGPNYLKWNVIWSNTAGGTAGAGANPLTFLTPFTPAYVNDDRTPIGGGFSFESAGTICPAVVHTNNSTNQMRINNATSGAAISGADQSSTSRFESLSGEFEI